MAFVQLADGELHYIGRPGRCAGAGAVELAGHRPAHVGRADAGLHRTFSRAAFRYSRARPVAGDAGPYSIEQLGRDVLALLDALHIERAHFCGLSMGGLIGQWLGINAGQRLNKLIVCNTAAKIGDPSVWNPRIETVLRDGPAAMVALRDASIARWFTPDFSAANPAAAKQITDMLAATHPEGYAANCAAVRDADFREQLASITVPLLVIAGTEDAVTPPSGGHFIQEHVRDAEYAEFYAAHLSNVQAGDAFSDRVLTFLLAD